MTDRITQLPAPPEARDDPAHTIEALNDQLRDQAIELDMLREALGVPYEPHQSLLERMLEAARGRAGSGAAPEPPAQEPGTAAEIEALRAECERLRADAERYRFLAERCRSTSEHWGGRWSVVIDGPAPASHNSKDDFDAAIDKAMEASNAG